jgi:hypothetical protein
MSVTLDRGETSKDGRSSDWGAPLLSHMQADAPTWYCQPLAGRLLSQETGSSPDIAGAFSTSPSGPKIEP